METTPVPEVPVAFATMETTLAYFAGDPAEAGLTTASHPKTPANANPTTDEAQPKKKARRATGTLRLWTAEEEARLRTLMLAFGAASSSTKPKRSDFDEFAYSLNDWAELAGVKGSARSGYAVEQRWLLYLAPLAPRGFKAATPAVPADLPVLDSGVSDDTAVDSAGSSSTATYGSTAVGSSPLAAASVTVLWDAIPEDARRLLGVDIEALTMQTAENLSLHSMSRMCRKGMGFRSTDDRRLWELNIRSTRPLRSANCAWCSPMSRRSRRTSGRRACGRFNAPSAKHGTRGARRT
jgi:hypothetical protein